MEYESEKRRLEQQAQLRSINSSSAQQQQQTVSRASLTSSSKSRITANSIAPVSPVSIRLGNDNSVSPSKNNVKETKRKTITSLKKNMNIALSSEVLPYGVHHIDPALLFGSNSTQDSTFLNFVLNNTDILRKMKSNSNKPTSVVVNKSSDPAMVLAFTSKLDEQTKKVIDRQVFVQQLYECRIASLERYMAFCVMFHAMAVSSSHPWLMAPWNISRSQSNLRVATTGKRILLMLFLKSSFGNYI